MLQECGCDRNEDSVTVFKARRGRGEAGVGGGGLGEGSECTLAGGLGEGG